MSGKCGHIGCSNELCDGSCESGLCKLAEFFSMFGDCTRIKLLYALKDNEMCVQDIAEHLGMKQPAVSHQLKVLKQHSVVSVRTEGKMSYYKLNDGHIHDILNIAMVHLSH